MFEIEITINPDDLSEAFAEFDGYELRATTLAKSRVDAAQRRHWQKVKKLPYSPGYIGQLKPSGRHRAGVSGDPGYAVDTGALYSDLTQSTFSDGELDLYSDLDYAAVQEQLAQAKGSSLFDDGEILNIVEDATLEALGL